jgi:hypothetical protein
MKPSKTIFIIIGILAVLILVLFSFRAGMVVGYHQAQFTARWQDFHGPGPGFLRDHGITGVVSSVNRVSDATTSIIIHDVHDSVDKTALVSAQTAIFAEPSQLATTSSDAIRAGQTIDVVGWPNNDGDIVAGVIRVLHGQLQK